LSLTCTSSIVYPSSAAASPARVTTSVIGGRWEATLMTLSFSPPPEPPAPHAARARAVVPARAVRAKLRRLNRCRVMGVSFLVRRRSARPLVDDAGKQGARSLDDHHEHDHDEDRRVHQVVFVGLVAVPDREVAHAAAADDAHDGG